MKENKKKINIFTKIDSNDTKLVGSAIVYIINVYTCDVRKSPINCTVEPIHSGDIRKKLACHGSINKIRKSCTILTAPVSSSCSRKHTNLYVTKGNIIQYTDRDGSVEQYVDTEYCDGFYKC